MAFWALMVGLGGVHIEESGASTIHEDALPIYNLSPEF